MPLFLVASFVLLNDVYLNAIPCATEAEEEEVGVDSATEMTLGRWMFGFLAASLCDDPPLPGSTMLPHLLVSEALHSSLRPYLDDQGLLPNGSYMCLDGAARTGDWKKAKRCLHAQVKMGSKGSRRPPKAR